MKKLLLLCTSLLVTGVTLTAQNLTTHRDYYDWFQTRIHHKWTTRPDGKYHGDFITYRQNGSVYCIENYANGKYSSFKHLFEDGTVASTGKVIIKSSMDAYNTCKEYSLYTLSDSGRRALRMQSKLYQQTKSDSLGDYTIHRDLGWGNSATCFMYDHRLESYSEYYSNGKIALRFTTSPDKNLETIMKYDETGKLVVHQVYNVKEGSLSWIVLDDGSRYTIRNNVLTLNRDVELKAGDGFLYNYKAGSTFHNTISVQMSRQQFYEKILTCAEDDCTKNYVVRVNYPLSMDFEENFAQLTEKTVEKEKIGRVFKMKLNWPDGHWVRWDKVLKADPENPNLYCFQEETPRYKAHLKATYDKDSLIYFDYLNEESGYAYRGGIKNLKPEGTVYFKCSYNGWVDIWNGEARNGIINKGELICQHMGSSAKVVYNGSFLNNLFEGDGEMYVYDEKGNEDYRYVGQFAKGQKLQGRQIHQHGGLYEGTWKDDKLYSGVVRELSNQTDTLYTYYTDGQADGHTLYKSGKTGASFETLSPMKLESPGQGVYIAPNQDRYEGFFTSNDISNGELLLHHFVKGNAKFKLENGDSYKGECMTAGLFSTKIVFEGAGHLIKSNGDYYIGVFSKGKFIGNGDVRVTDKNNKVYEGKYQNNLPNGAGKLIYPSGTILSGNFKMGVPSDQCEIQYANGDFYQGLVLDEQPHGHGSCTYQDGNVYVGQWLQGKRQGSGKLTTTSNIVYKGVWKTDKLNGEVSITDGDNHYQLSYKMGVIGKTAMIQFENGDKFEGQIDNGNYKSGTYTFADGMIYSGSWINGKPAKVKVTDAQGAKVSTKGIYEYREVCPFDKNLLIAK